MKNKAVIFGNGNFSEIAHFYLTHDSEYEIAGFTIDGPRIQQSDFLGLPLVSFEEVESEFSPEDHLMFIAVGYRDMNKTREKIFMRARDKGYRMLSYVSSKAHFWGEKKVGDNVFILEGNVIQPFGAIEDNVTLWSGNHIGHHSIIGAHTFISSHVVISGGCKIGLRCFVGVNATIADNVSIADDNLIGPGALIQKSTGPDEVYFADRAKKFPKSSARFFR
jgi:sugar O-acyltransferase (sialic acid O-acetyltransferase NeuD family)